MGFGKRIDHALTKLFPKSVYQPIYQNVPSKQKSPSMQQTLQQNLPPTAHSSKLPITTNHKTFHLKNRKKA